jgi:LacI family transcriptional regulator
MTFPGSDGTTPRGRRSTVVRLADVAREAQVSTALASRVLNSDPSARATPETKGRIIATAARLGYVPNIAARGLRVKRNGLLGLVVHDLSSPIHLDLMRGARAEAAAHNSFLVLADVEELLHDEQAFKILINGNRVDGLIVQGGQGEFDQRIAEIARVLPTVVVNAPSPIDRVLNVYPDELAAARLLTEHLVALRHRRIALISGPKESMTSSLREEGIRAVLAEHGLELRSEDCVYRDWSVAGGRDGLDELVARWNAAGSRPTALVTGNSLIGIGVLGTAHKLGLTVPDNLSVAAIHDAWINEHLVPSLTTVSLPLREMGVVAVRQLMSEPDVSSKIILSDPPPELHVRESTREAGVRP